MMKINTNARLSTLDQLQQTLIPAYLTPVPSRETLRDWLDSARIPRFKANPAARRGGGPVFYAVAAVEKFLQTRTLPCLKTAANPINTAVGGQDLCAWQPARGVVWVQTRNPNHALRMAKRDDGRLVARGVAGGYLMTFEFRRSLTWAIRLMRLYTTAEKTANEALGRTICPETGFNTVEERK